MKRLVLYVCGLITVACWLEVLCRYSQPLLRAVSHRSLFKAALLQRRLPQDIVFFGTSRTGEALRPGPFVDELQREGAPRLRAFNVSTPYSSLDILDVVATRFAGAPELKLALVEISEPQVHRNTLPWADEPAIDADWDSRAFDWLKGHSALVAERKAFVLNSLGRLAIVGLFGSHCDGTEEMGGDYLKVALGRKRDVDPSQFLPVDCQPETIAPAPGPVAGWGAEPDIYAHIARAFDAHHVATVFYIPPFREPSDAIENSPSYRALYGAIADRTGKPVWSFGGCRLPATYFRDPTHLSTLGGSHFSHLVAREVMARHALP